MEKKSKEIEKYLRDRNPDCTKVEVKYIYYALGSNDKLRPDLVYAHVNIEFPYSTLYTTYKFPMDKFPETNLLPNHLFHIEE